MPHRSTLRPSLERDPPALRAMAFFLLALLLVLLVWPVGSVVRAGFVDREGATLFYFQSAFAQPYLGGLFNSFLLATASTLLCFLIGMPLAWLMTHHDPPLKRLLSALLLIPLILPPFVGALGLRRLLAPNGGPLVLLARWAGLIGPQATPDLLKASPMIVCAILIALHLYPIMYLNLQAALANVDPAMEEAAENLSAGRWTVFRRVTLPLMLPGLFAGATIVFIWSFTELGTPLMVGFRDVAAVQVFDGLKQIDQNPLPYALVVVLLGASVLAYALGKAWLGGGESHAMVARASTARTPAKMRPLTGGLASGLTALLIALATLPHLGVVLLALAGRWQGTILPGEWTLEYVANVLQHPVTGPSIVNSLKYASAATLIDLGLGVAIGYVIARSRVRWRGALDALAMLPLAIPGLVMAFGYLAITRQGSPLAFLNPDRGDPTLLLIIAYAVRRLPYVVRATVAGLQQTSVSLEEAAVNLGASRPRALRVVTLPLIASNLIAGGILAFSYAVLEVSDSLILAFRQQQYPITKAMYMLSERLGDGIAMASALGLVGMLLLGATLMAASLLLGRKLGALFRF